MTYQVAERFKSIQGEGLFTGTPMAFIRFSGCSVGKKTCHACDTDFEKPLPWRGGGTFTQEELVAWAQPYKHICLTGGEPLDQDLEPIIGTVNNMGRRDTVLHIETSGTVDPAGHSWLRGRDPSRIWVCVSPKPGYRMDMIEAADEIKLIVPGLGSGPGWPTLKDALRWAGRTLTPIYLQPRNTKFNVDQNALRLVQDILFEHPSLRLSVQMHKILRVQ